MAKLYMISSILMAALFIVSASVQFNDKGWLAWILLYASAAYVNLTSCIKQLPLKFVGGMSKLTGFHAQFLLTQVILDDSFHGKAGLWSLDMREKLVREKLGCILVILSVVLQTSAIELFHRDPSRRVNMQVSPSIQNGMAILVGIGYGLSFVFLKYHEQDMKF
uniref:Uncharacterized protein n=2 Tax=Opuntia streptacantha TaxID=393608 RepID=A0A7C9CRQ0_OPUST